MLLLTQVISNFILYLWKIIIFINFQKMQFSLEKRHTKRFKSPTLRQENNIRAKISQIEKIKDHLNSILKLTDEKKTLSQKMSKSCSTRSNFQFNTQVPSKIQTIRKNIIGFNTHYISPLNFELEAVYVDHTATNRAYQPIEKMIANAKQLCANPHTEFSYFGKYCTKMMNYAQSSLLRSFSANPSDFLALPVGSGSTGAIEKTVRILQNHLKNGSIAIYVSPYEHHSNILPWIQFFGNVNVLAGDEQGTLLMEEIQKQLSANSASTIIVSCSSASNVTSKLTDLGQLNKTIAKVRKTKNIIFAIDCAAFCCHHELNLQKLNQIDFVYLSPHKNLGGAESCGVLIARKSIVGKNDKPSFPGGGTVVFVKGYTPNDVQFDENLFNREVAGTPPFLGFYRAALSFQLLKNDIGYSFIHEREKANTKLFIKLISEANQRFKDRNVQHRIVIYGDSDFDKRANVVTFSIADRGQLVQYNFASLVLTDLFGIQLRSGCFCAGPFGMKLLHIDYQVAERLANEVRNGQLSSKPGYLRLDLAFYLEPYEIEYLAKAIIAAAEHISKMRVIYFICKDGQIKRRGQFMEREDDFFSLQNVAKAEEDLLKSKEQKVYRLANRQILLKNQFKRGLKIISNPVRFLFSK